MDTVKTRKVGNSLTVTIPKALDVPEGQEMVVYKGASPARQLREWIEVPVTIKSPTPERPL